MAMISDIVKHTLIVSTFYHSWSFLSTQGRIYNFLILFVHHVYPIPLFFYGRDLYATLSGT